MAGLAIGSAIAARWKLRTARPLRIYAGLEIFPRAIQFLEQENEHGFSNAADLFLLIYLYCVNGEVEKAEALAAAKNGAIHKDWFVEWLWAIFRPTLVFTRRGEPNLEVMRRR